VSRVVVVGAGVAGTGAALAAARAGAAVTVVDGGTGASTLTTGAIDAVAWPHPVAPVAPVARAVRDILDAIGGHRLPERGARLLTTAGVVRPARGHDASLLDVEPLAGKRIGVVRADRPGWDADAVARAWQDQDRPGPESAFVVVDAAIVRHGDERDLPDADFAARHDDDARLTWLAERLRAALGARSDRVGALVLPPCLGIEGARAQALAALVGLPCGEALAFPGGPPGLRFERARDRALSAAGVERVHERAVRVAKDGSRWTVAAETGWAAEADAVVIATGGLIGGGIEYAPGEAVHASALPPFARPPFRLTVDVPATLGAHGRPLELPSTLFGAAPESFAWPFVRDPLMTRVGILADDDGRTESGLLVAGDLRADRPRAWLEALATGVVAGTSAALGAVSAAGRTRSSAPALPIRP
jgi:glycerol-3-phosphate dehydrogenase subunit B